MRMQNAGMPARMNGAVDARCRSIGEAVPGDDFSIEVDLHEIAGANLGPVQSGRSA